MKPKYKLRGSLGFKSKGLDVNAVGAELNSLSASGDLTADKVVQAAEDDSSPLHNAFEWDDSQAAHQHRLAQARSLIRAVVIVGAPDQPNTPAYYRIIDRHDQASYQRTVKLVNNETMLQSALDLLRAELESAQRSLQDLEAAAQRYRNKPLAAKAARVRMPLDEAARAARR